MRIAKVIKIAVEEAVESIYPDVPKEEIKTWFDLEEKFSKTEEQLAKEMQHWDNLYDSKQISREEYEKNVKPIADTIDELQMRAQENSSKWMNYQDSFDRGKD